MPVNGADPRFTGLVEAARVLQPRTVALRRAVHRHPEVGLRLPVTQAAILRTLGGLPLKVRSGAGLSSVVAVLDGERRGPTVLLRADMDALPLAERTGLAFASEQDAAMHACGHDTHVAMLASAARLLCERKAALAGHVVFMFQPGEEGQGGADQMIEEGVLTAADTAVYRAFALHITSSTTSGVVACRPGPLMASSDTFTVRVAGRGGHAAMPHDALDPVPAAAAAGTGSTASCGMAAWPPLPATRTRNVSEEAISGPGLHATTPDVLLDVMCSAKAPVTGESEPSARLESSSNPSSSMNLAP